MRTGRRDLALEGTGGGSGGRAGGALVGLIAVAAAAALDARVAFAMVDSPADPAGDPRRLGALLAAHAVLAVIGALGLRAALPRPSAREAAAVTATALVLGLAMPVLGVAGLCAALGIASSAARARLAEPWKHLPVDLEGREWRPHGPKDASATALAATLAERAPEQAARRFAAVVRAMQLPQRAGVPLLRAALRDPAEEVRLFAFSRLERMRDALDKAVREFLGSLERADDVATREHVHLRLAETYWEFAYLGLAEGSVLEHALSKALEHASLSDSVGSRAASASFLRGRILLHRLEPEAATAAFERASRLGYPQQKVLPYLAECAFRARRFDRVREHLRRLEEVTRGHAPLVRVRELWR